MRKTLVRLLAEREPTYAEANITVDNGEQSTELITDKIVTTLDTYLTTPQTTTQRASS
jgi:Shikimate kinase